VSDDVELLIAGGGLTGLSLGVACAGVGLAVAVVDRQDPAALLADDFDGRSSAIGYGSHRVLDAIGLWPQIASDAEPILEIRVADGDSPLFLHSTIASSAPAPRSATSSKTAFSGAS